MTLFSVHSSKLTGRPDQGGWSQVYDYLPDDSISQKEKGHLYVVLSTKNLLKNDNKTELGQEIFLKLREKYYSLPGRSSLLGLKEVVETTIKEFGLESGIQIAALIIVDNLIYLISSGGTKIYIMRESNFIALVESNLNEIKTSSGIVKKDDLFLVSTDSFYRNFAKSVIKTSLESKDTELVVESFAPLVRSLETAGDIGLLLLKIEEKQIVENTEISKEELKVVLEESTLDRIENVKQDRVFSPAQLPNKLPAFFKKLVEKKLYVGNEIQNTENYKKRKVSALAGLLLLLILSISIFFGIKQKKHIEQKSNYENELTLAKHDLEESQNLATLNPERSRELFLQSKGKVLGLSDSGVKDPELENLKRSIEEIQATVLGEFEIESESFIDLGLLSDGLSGTDLVLTGGFLYVLDNNSKKLAKITIENKRSEVIAGPSKLEDVSDFAAYLDNIYISGKSGIFDITSDKKKIINNPSQDSIIPFAYASNIYSLDKTQSKIRRYSAGIDKFSDGKEWLSSDVTLDLSSAKEMMIDGNIWVLTERGEIYKFTSGNLQKFKLPSDFKDLKTDYLFTGDEVEHLYLLDKTGERIIVLTKDGEYKAQYKSEEIKNALKFVVSEKENKIILLNGNKLFSIELKNL